MLPDVPHPSPGEGAMEAQGQCCLMLCLHAPLHFPRPGLVPLQSQAGDFTGIMHSLEALWARFTPAADRSVISAASLYANFHAVGSQVR